jgi:hypothetical protein
MSNELRRWMTLVEGQVRLVESTPRTLYHGTLRKFLPSILARGLWPSVGAFTKQMYDEEDHIPELVFAGDKKGMIRCFSAVASWVAIEYGGTYTVEKIKQYGALCVLKQAGDKFEYRDPDNDYEDAPVQVERGDYYREDSISVSHVLTGNRMLHAFSKYANIRPEGWRKPGNLTRP